MFTWIANIIYWFQNEILSHTILSLCISLIPLIPSIILAIFIVDNQKNETISKLEDKGESYINSVSENLNNLRKIKRYAYENLWFIFSWEMFMGYLLLYLAVNTLPIIISLGHFKNLSSLYNQISGLKSGTILIFAIWFLKKPFTVLFKILMNSRENFVTISDALEKQTDFLKYIRIAKQKIKDLKK